MKTMKKQKSLIALLVCLALCLISMIGTWCGITDGGNVKVYDLSIDTNKGDVVRFLEYRPKTASVENPVPAIIYSPGNDSTAESVRLTSVELARRGYDVFVLDLLSAGHSSIGVGNSTTFGFQELIDYVYDNLDYIDNAHIGIAGYSKGGGNVVRVMNDYGTQQREDPDHYVRKVDAALIMAPPFSPLGDVAKGINLGFAAGKYDPYSRIGFAPVEGYWPGDLSVKREMKETINFGVPGTFSEADLDNPDVKVEIGHTYGSFSENNARVVYNPADSTHGSGMISRGFIFATVDFFMKAIPAPNPIDANNLTYLSVMLFSALGLVALLAMTVPVTLLLLDTPLFAALRHPAKPPVSALNTKKDWTIFVTASMVAGFVPPIMAPVIIQQTSKIFSLTGQGTTGSIFVYGVANNVVVWMMFSALFLLAMFFLFYNVIHKKNGVKLADYDIKVSLADVGRIILMVFAVVLTCRSVVWFADYFFKVDFRLVDLSMATMNWNHLRVSLCYAPFFILYWCINSLTMNGCNRFKNMSEGKNLLLCVLCNTLGTVVVVLVYYICLYKTGCGIGAFGNWKAYMMLSYMILSATAGTIINRKIYNATGSLYLGPAVFGTLIAIINTAVYTLPAA